MVERTNRALPAFNLSQMGTGPDNGKKPQPYPTSIVNSRNFSVLQEFDKSLNRERKDKLHLQSPAGFEPGGSPGW